MPTLVTVVLGGVTSSKFQRKWEVRGSSWGLERSRRPKHEGSPSAILGLSARRIVCDSKEVVSDGRKFVPRAAPQDEQKNCPAYQGDLPPEHQERGLHAGPRLALGIVRD
eukprot:2073022-Rhodomonas_salina.1